jgi:hypothetical protein
MIHVQETIADINDANKEERVYSGFQDPHSACERKISKHTVLRRGLLLLSLCLYLSTFGRSVCVCSCTIGGDSG